MTADEAGSKVLVRRLEREGKDRRKGKARRGLRIYDQVYSLAEKLYYRLWHGLSLFCWLWNLNNNNNNICLGATPLCI